MHKLGITDASFLYMESPSNPMNIGSVQLLDVPQRDGFFNELKLYLADRVRAIPFMCKRLKSTPFTLDQPVWVDDPTFAIDNHVTRVVLGAPGTWLQLEAMVARLHETPLPRDKPLWAFYYIEGLEIGTGGVVLQVSPRVHRRHGRTGDHRRAVLARCRNRSAGCAACGR